MTATFPCSHAIRRWFSEVAQLALPRPAIRRSNRDRCISRHAGEDSVKPRCDCGQTAPERLDSAGPAAFSRRKPCARFAGNRWDSKDNYLTNQQLRRVSRKIDATAVAGGAV